MTKKLVLTMALCFSFCLPVLAGNKDRDKFIKHIKNTSVTVKAAVNSGYGESGEATGSGVIVTRTLKDKNGKTHIVNFVWTAGHVVDSLRNVRSATDSKTGAKKQIVEFGTPYIVKELINQKTGIKEGEVRLVTKVLCYSDADTGEDLALLIILKEDFVKATTTFYLKKSIPSIGTPLCHIGSRFGDIGSGSFSAGHLSYIGRMLKLSTATTKVFDQTSVPASPGSSGGGMFVQWGDEDETKCVGLIVRGGEASFNFIVPVRRMKDWAKKMNIEFALDPKAKMPTLEDLNSIAIDDGWVKKAGKKKTASKKYSSKYPFYLHTKDTKIIKAGPINKEEKDPKQPARRFLLHKQFTEKAVGLHR